MRRGPLAPEQPAGRGSWRSALNARTPPATTCESLARVHFVSENHSGNFPDKGGFQSPAPCCLPLCESENWAMRALSGCLGFDRDFKTLWRVGGSPKQEETPRSSAGTAPSVQRALKRHCGSDPSGVSCTLQVSDTRSHCGPCYGVREA